MLKLKKPDFTKVTANVARYRGFAAQVENLFVAAHLSDLEVVRRFFAPEGKVEGLLHLRNLAHESFTRQANAENRRAAKGLILGAVCLAAAGVGIFVAPAVVAVAGVVCVLGFASAHSAFRRRDLVLTDRHTFITRINSEVAGIAAQSPQMAARSCLYAKSVKSDFTAATTPYNAEAFDRLRKRVAIACGAPG